MHGGPSRMAACPLRRRCNCSTHAPCSTHTPSPRMRSYFGRRCYFSVHAPIVFGMRERDATEPSGRRLAHTLLCSQGGGRRCHRMRGLRGLERIPGEQHPDGAQVRDEGGGGMPTGCTRGALRRVCRARTWSHRFCWHAQDAMYTVVRAASDEMEVSRARGTICSICRK